MSRIALPAAHDRSRHASRAEIADLAWMQAHRDEWSRLAAEAASPNPFYAPMVLEAHVASGLVAAPTFAVAREGGRLAGILPLAPGRTRFGWIGRTANAVHSPFMVSSTPLVAADDVEHAIDVLLDGAAEAAPGLVRMPLLRIDDTVGRALLGALAARGWAACIAAPFRRAVLDRRSDHAVFEETLPGHRRKDLRRRRRRLAELGTVALETDDGPATLPGGLEDFLALEASGWKGARGTALLSRADTAAYARALATNRDAATRLRIDRLTLDGRSIAASLALIAGGTAYLYKTAYDEALARYAPGVLLEMEIVRAMHETGFAVRLNSASVAGSLLDTIHPDREEVGDLLFSSDPSTSQLALDRMAAQDATRLALLRGAKDGYWRARRVLGGN